MIKSQVNGEVTRGQNKKPKLELVHRLTNEERLKVIQWLVELKSSNRIKELIKEQFGKDISRKSIWQYRYSKRWKPLIDKVRIEFERNLAKIPIANKADRLRYLQKVVDEGLKWSLKNITKDGNEIYELKLGAVTKAIEAAKEEREPRKSTIDQSQHFHYTSIKQVIENATNHRNRTAESPASPEALER